jgi:hypothetical protein
VKPYRCDECLKFFTKEPVLVQLPVRDPMHFCNLYCALETLQRFNSAREQEVRVKEAKSKSKLSH